MAGSLKDGAESMQIRQTGHVSSRPQGLDSKEAIMQPFENLLGEWCHCVTSKGAQKRIQGEQ